MNSGSELYNVGRARLSKLGATPKLDVVEWPILIKMLQARTRLEQEAPPGEYTRLITEVWNILLRELPSSSKETRRRLKKHAGNPSFVVRDDGQDGDFPHGPQIFLITQGVNGSDGEPTACEKLFVPPWHIDKVLNANHPYNQTYVNNRQMHTGGEALFALIGNQYYGVSRKKCQQWVNDCPICKAARFQQQTITVDYRNSLDGFSQDLNIDGVPTYDFTIDKSSSYGRLSSGKIMLDGELRSPPPKRLKAESKPHFVMNVDKCEKKLRSYVAETPLYQSDYYSYKIRANVYLKCENSQISGSYKARGVFFKLLSEKDRFKKNGLPYIITASSGNHALAMITALKTFDVGGDILLPNSISRSKFDAIQKLINTVTGPRITLRFSSGSTTLDAEKEARQESVQRNIMYIPPYNDLEVIYGYASIVPEMLRQMRKTDGRKIDYIIVPVGRGGLISGIAEYFKEIAPFTDEHAKIIGVCPENDCPMIDVLKGERIKNDMKTLADAVSGGIEENSITFEICSNNVDEWVKISEAEIEEALWDMLKQNIIIEGAAALAIAALYKDHERYAGKNVVAILTGGNLGLDNLQYIMSKFTNHSNV